jgi:cell wall integrity and stress response component
MVHIPFVSALAAAAMLLSVAADDAPTPTTSVKNHITTPTVVKAASEMTTIGCFATGTPLENHGDYLYRTPGNCQLVCLQENKNVMAVSDGENCWCGDKIPAKEWAVDNSTCDTQCRGDKTVKCTWCAILVVILANTAQVVGQVYCG